LNIKIIKIAVWLNTTQNYCNQTLMYFAVPKHLCCNMSNETLVGQTDRNFKLRYLEH